MGTIFRRAVAAVVAMARVVRAHPGRLWVSAGVIALFFAIPAGLFASNIVDAGGALNLSAPARYLTQPKDDYYGTPTIVFPRESYDPASDFCVTFEFIGLTPSDSRITLGVLVGITHHGLSDLARRITPKYQNVSLWITSYSGLSSINIPISVSDLEHRPAQSVCGTGQVPARDLDQRAAFRTNLGVFVLGQARAFPQDWYQLDDSVTVRAGQFQDGTALPSSLLVMSRDQDMTVKVHLDDSAQEYSPLSHQLMFTVRRPLLIVTYTYWIAAMPFVLLIVLLGMKYVIKRRAVPEVYEIAFGVAATLVAILPLRTVLVPSTLPDLTRLDLCFSIGITFLVAGSILWVVVWGPAESTGPAGGPDDRDPAGLTAPRELIQPTEPAAP
ncbi:MAG TPA: hypothetical protein VH637_11940 [Streptosporangiaceae bacterium]